MNSNNFLHAANMYFLQILIRENIGHACMGHTPSTAGTFRKKFRKDSGKTPETLSERFLEFPSRVRLGCPKPYNSRHLRLPEHFQNYLPPSTAGGASFFRSGSGEGLPELVMEFPAVLGVFLNVSLLSTIAIRLNLMRSHVHFTSTNSEDSPHGCILFVQPEGGTVL